MNNTLSYMLTFKTYALLVAKYISMLLCLLLISKYQEYKIEWNLLTYFFPQIAHHINDLLSLCSTFILVIPFSIMGTTISIIKGIWTNTLGHAYNLGFIVITHTATLEYKF